jgi:hypothetical protein
MVGKPTEPDEQRTADSGSRRAFLKKAAIGGAAAWTAPTLLSTAAWAQGTGPLPAHIRTESITSGVAGDIVVGGVNPDSDGNAQIAFAFVPLLGDGTNVTVTPQPGSGPAWTLLVDSFESQDTTAGVGPSTPTLASRLRLYVWARVVAFPGTIADADVTVTLSDPDGVLNGSWRAGADTFSGVSNIANDAGEVLALGGGAADVRSVTAPAITYNSANAFGWWIGAINDSTPLTSPTAAPLAPCALGVFGDANASSPSYYVGGSIPVGGVVPSCTSSPLVPVNQAGRAVGVHVAVEG